MWERTTISSGSLSTHLCPGGSVNSPSPVAPFPPGVVVRAAPVLRCTVPLIHLRRLPSHPEIQTPPLYGCRERSGMKAILGSLEETGRMRLDGSEWGDLQRRSTDGEKRREEGC